MRVKNLLVLPYKTQSGVFLCVLDKGEVIASGFETPADALAGINR